MSSLALMRWLESTPARYDAGMRWLTLGRIDRLHDALAAVAEPGAHILEIGCGTGAVTQRLVERGATLVALDQNPEMLDLARARLARTPKAAVTWLEQSAAEIDQMPEACFDAVVASLVLSEMSAGERRFVLAAAARRLRPGGVLAVADEVRPRGWRRPLVALARAPQMLLGWLLAGSTSRPLAALGEEIAAAGLALRGERRWLAGSLAVCLAVREP